MFNSTRTRAIQLGLSVSIKAGKPPENLLSFFPFPPLQGWVLGMEKPVSFSDKFSKLYLVELPLMKRMFVVDIGRYFRCSMPVRLVSRNVILARL